MHPYRLPAVPALPEHWAPAYLFGCGKSQLAPALWDRPGNTGRRFAIRRQIRANSVEPITFPQSAGAARRQNSADEDMEEPRDGSLARQSRTSAGARIGRRSGVAREDGLGRVTAAQATLARLSHGPGKVPRDVRKAGSNGRPGPLPSRGRIPRLSSSLAPSPDGHDPPSGRGRSMSCRRSVIHSHPFQKPTTPRWRPILSECRSHAAIQRSAA
jgi:hypothetical protein